VRGNIREFVRVLVDTLALPQPIVEIGALQVEGQPYSADLRPLFAESGYTDYIGCDVRPGLGVDRIEDVHQLSFATDSIGSVLMLETLEHVKNPLQAMAEVFRVLQPGGVVVISSCMDFPVHEYPADYWRFPPQGFDLLLERFSPRRVYLQGSPVFPHSLVGIGQKERRSHGDQQDQQDQQDTKVAPQVTQALARLDGLVRTISGTLTQEISPRLGHDPFRLLGEDLAEEEQVHYPEKMLHVAYDRILQKDEEIQRLQNEVNRLLGEREQHAEKLL
jgi:SAM-dependent methyltransferase